MFGFISNSTLLAELIAIARVQSSQSTQLLSIISASSSLTNELAVIAKAQLAESEQLDTLIQLCTPVPSTAVKIVLELPRITKKGIVMPNYELPNDEVATITIKTTDSAGNTEPVPAGDVFTAVSSSASLGVAIGKDAAGAPALVLTPMVQASPNISVTVSDSAGLTQAVQLVDIVPDVTPHNIVLDLADAVQTPQAMPTAPGP